VDVGTWLRNLGLDQYEAAFRDNSVDGDILPRLTGEDLKELGIASVGHRRKLLDAMSGRRPVVKGRIEGSVNVSGAVMSSAF
jgi:hypothetical protein